MNRVVSTTAGIAFVVLLSSHALRGADNPLVAHWPAAELKTAGSERILLETPTHLFKLVQRKPGVAAIAEAHDGTTDIYFVVSGSGSITAGGTIEGATTLQGMPGEFRGSHLTGGKRYALEPHAVINIPPSTPYLIEPGASGITAVLLKVN